MRSIDLRFTYLLYFVVWQMHVVAVITSVE